MIWLDWPALSVRRHLLLRRLHQLSHHGLGEGRLRRMPKNDICAVRWAGAGGRAGGSAHQRDRTALGRVAHEVAHQLLHRSARELGSLELLKASKLLLGSHLDKLLIQLTARQGHGGALSGRCLVTAQCGRSSRCAPHPVLRGALCQPFLHLVVLPILPTTLLLLILVRVVHIIFLVLVWRLALRHNGCTCCLRGKWSGGERAARLRRG